MTIMMVTSESEHGQIVRALAAGAHEYVIKPFTADAMRDKLALLGLVPQEVVAVTQRRHRERRRAPSTAPSSRADRRGTVQSIAEDAWPPWSARRRTSYRSPASSRRRAQLGRRRRPVERHVVLTTARGTAAELSRACSGTTPGRDRRRGHRRRLRRARQRRRRQRQGRLPGPSALGLPEVGAAPALRNPTTCAGSTSCGAANPCPFRAGCPAGPARHSKH